MKNSKLLKNCIGKEFDLMKESIQENFKINMNNRELNPFLVFKDKDIKKYMALGRSFDSQLGNRMQRIIFYSARLKYGDKNVPNVIAINIDKQRQLIKLSRFFVPIDIDDKEKCKNANLFNQYIYITDKDFTKDEIKKILKLKKKANSLKEIQNEFVNVNSDIIETILNEEQKKNKKIFVDLIYFKGEKNKITANSFEIKLGGNLDTKNSSANVEEVEKLQKYFSFMKKSSSYFATCYSTCSNSVKKKLSKEQILENEAFWEKILPDDISYDEFINIYENMFNEVKMEKFLKDL